MSRLYVERRGTGPDLALLHGWALHGGVWGPWLESLAARFTLHLIDLPGHGRSAWPESVTDLQGLARSVAPHVPSRAAVVGWSLGGMVALELARTRPADLAALVLVATTPCFLQRPDWPHGMAPMTLQGFAAGLAKDHRRTIANFLALQTWGDEHATEALRSLRSSLDAHGEPDPRALAAGLEILREADLRTELSRVTTPALVLAGGRDRITPAAAGRELASALPAARYHEIEKAGHAPFLSHGEDVAREVGRFLEFLIREPSPRPSPTSWEREQTPSPQPSPAEREREDLALDAARVRRSFAAAAHTYDAAAVLQRRVREELLQRLDALTMEPQTVLDLGAGTGHGAAALQRRYGCRVLALDVAPPMLAEAGRQASSTPSFERIAADAAALPLADGSVDMIFSSLMLQWCDEPDQVFRECRRVLRPGGVLHLATLGPDTLVELRRAWRAADPGHAHVNRFLDLHDVGDALVRAGFAEPVLDVERYVLTYEDARELMRDLKALGAHNATAGRARGLTGKGALQRMLAAYERERRDGRLPATYEVVHAQAWCPDRPQPRGPLSRGEFTVPLDRIGRRH